MKEFLQNLWLKIWRMWRKKFFLRHLYMLLLLIILLITISWLFVSWWTNYNPYSFIYMIVLFWNTSIILIPFLYLLSNFYLAKRFQDCWICWVRVFVFWIIFILWMIFPLWKRFSIFIWLNDIFSYTYLILIIIMCLIKWDAGPNKYGNPV